MNLHMPFTSSHFGLINTVNVLILKIIDLQVLHVCLTCTATVAFNYVIYYTCMHYIPHTSTTTIILKWNIGKIAATKIVPCHLQHLTTTTED